MCAGFNRPDSTFQYAGSDPCPLSRQRSRHRAVQDPLSIYARSGTHLAVFFYVLLLLYTFFKASLFQFPVQVFHPIGNLHGMINFGLFIEAFATFLCTVVILVLPEMLSVNKLNPKILSAVMFPIVFLHHNAQWCNLNPSVAYALWYVNRVRYEIPSGPQWLNIIAPFLGAVAAGLFCNAFFPDRPTSWARRSERFK